MSCGTITRGAEYDCQNPPQGGLGDRLVLFNYDDIVSYTQGSDGKISAITLANGASGYSFNGFKSNNATDEAIALGSGQTLFKHSITFSIFDISQWQKNNIQKMAVGKFVAIVQNTKRDQNAFEVYGLNNGLELPAGVIRNHNENNGVFTMTLSTRDGQAESKLPQTLFDTDYATTLALVDGFLYLPAVYNLTDIALSTAGGDAVSVAGVNFFGGGAANDVQSVVWVNQSTLAETTQTSVTVSNDTTLSFSSVALTAGTYKLKVTTSKGSATSTVNVVVS